ncbi:MULTISPECIES: AbrB family transcriptional regulator [Vibrio]|uniref:AbrB protein n=1 Tax=Vibrio halioticoli NBRC 102217 TaxID=1219072 RepID=V5HIB1_9VIBR|nr:MULTISPECIES: AbrB family transcriptional regulator [Vibrio]MPW35250.1 AbrB family transcriptional regulator [Vibrio sp. B1Z05]GAD89080.1 AbrB protein [Vibrio halioticoli NBRC 102217]
MFSFRALFVYSACLLAGVLFDSVHIPAATLLGPMLAAIVFSFYKCSVKTPKSAIYLIQSVIGLMAGRVLDLSILKPFLSIWWIFVGVALVVLLACQLMGYSLAKLRILPGSTAIWGCAPGGASAMVVMAESYGNDPSLVAFMQYLRVVMVSLLAATVAHFLAIGAAQSTQLHIQHWLDPHPLLAVLETLFIIVATSYLGVKSRLPAGCFLVSIFVSAFCVNSGVAVLEVPEWILDIAYLVLGVSIGMRFSPEIVKQALFALPKILLSILGLISLCGLVAVLLVQVFHVSPLTAYLATTPGGLDAVTAIALSSHTQVNLGFVMSMQIVRLLMVVLLAPHMAQFASKRFMRVSQA